jgi:AraC-like DNA-binding protein
VVEVIINLGSPHLVVDLEHPERSEVFRESWIAGIQRRFLVIEAVREDNLVGIRFKPGGAYPFFRMSMEALSNDVVELDLLDRAFFAELRERLLGAPSRDERVRIVEDMLLSRLDWRRADDRRVRGVMDALDRGGSSISIASACSAVGCSQKHVIQLFRERVGMAPKLLSRVLRFDAVIRGVQGQPRIRWTDVAPRFGYFDQAHLIADFQEFAGASPTGYWEARSDDGAHILLTR